MHDQRADNGKAAYTNSPPMKHIFPSTHKPGN